MKLFYSSKVVMLLEIESALFLPTEVNFLIQQTFNKHVAKKKKRVSYYPCPHRACVLEGIEGNTCISVKEISRGALRALRALAHTVGLVQLTSFHPLSLSS